MNPIEFFVTGEPIPAPRPRARIVSPPGRKPFVHIYTPAKDEKWKKKIALLAWQSVKRLIDGPVRVDCEFIFPRPDAHFGTGRNAGTLKASAPFWHTPRGGGDRDNLDKPVLDALEAAGVVSNDSIVCDGRITKRYARPGEQPGARITITPLSQENDLWQSERKPTTSTTTTPNPC